jgi:cell division protein FtsB
MKEFQERSRMRRFAYSRFVFFILLFFVVYAGFSVKREYDRSREALALRESAEREMSKVIERTENLSSQIERLKTPLGQEEELRSRYGVKKPGEEYVVIVEETPAPKTETANAAGEVKNTDIKKNFWEKIVDWFRGL